jgi:hypothetical protein
MYGIFTNICPKNQPNVGKYTIHGAYGIWKSPSTTEIPYGNPEIAGPWRCGGFPGFPSRYVLLGKATGWTFERKVLRKPSENRD